MAVLSQDELGARLGELAGWGQGEAEIHKEFELGSFPDAISFVVRLSYEAEARNHHPDLDVRYNQVRVVLSTHSEGGVTEKDLELASAIESLALPAGD